MNYYYAIHEIYPVEDGDGISKAIVIRDTLEAIQTVLDALTSTDVNFTVYVIVLTPNG